MESYFISYCTTWAEKSRDFSIRGATRKWTWFISRGSSLVYVWSFMTFRTFVYKLRLSKVLLSPSFCTITITHRHTHPWKRWPNWTNSNWSLTHRILQTWPPATIICSQTSSGDSRERDSHRIRKSSRKPRRISKA